MSESAAMTVADLLSFLNQPRFILLMGLPASGKSTIAEQLDAAGFVRLNADAIRKELYGDEAEQGDPKKVWGILMSRLGTALSKRQRIVLDLTNMTRSNRRPLIRKAVKKGVPVDLFLLDVPLAVCLERNKRRTRVVPEVVLRGMARGFKRSGLPRADEGRLTILRPGKQHGLYKVVSGETPLLLRRR